ncbi:MAG: carboxypeptidase regulatory-like domain-containing protein, partial [Armatimonadota bacterium]
MRSKENRLCYLVIICTMLLALSSVYAYAGNLMPDPSFENSFTAGNTYTSSIEIGNWYFHNVGSGSLSVVGDAKDGEKAVMLNRTSTTGDNFVFETHVTDRDLVPVVAGKRYRVTFWAKTDSVSPSVLRIIAASWTAGHTGVVNSSTNDFNLTTKWGFCSFSYTVPAGYANCALQFRPLSAGIVCLDSISIEDTDTLLGNIFPDPSFDGLVIGAHITSPTYTTVCSHAFTGNNVGSFDVVTPGQDGDTALQISRTAMSSDDTCIGLVGAPRTIIPVQPSHVYNISFWARSDGGYKLRNTLASYNQTAGSWLGDYFKEYVLTPSWAKYSYDYTTSPTTYFLNYSFRVMNIGSMVVDSVSIVDVTPSNLTGTVTSALSGSPISGAVVSITSSGTALSTTTNSIGVYTFSGLTPAEYVVTVAVAGYTTSSATLIVSGSKTQDFGLVPDANTSWTITDTFTRPANTDLGHTEDANAIPWVKTAGNTSSAINGDGKLQVDSGGVAGGACLGRGFAPTNFDMSV